MSFNIFNWLFDDPVTAGSRANLSGAEQFHYFWPYLIFCCVGLLIWFYFYVEGRKRFVDSTYYLKHMLERYLNWLAILCFIGIPIDLARVVLDGYFFAWRFWRYLWLVALLVWAVWWIVYLVRVFPELWRTEVNIRGKRKIYGKDIANSGDGGEAGKKEEVKKAKRVKNRKKKDRKKQREYARR